jgi:hypothetical protein
MWLTSSRRARPVRRNTRRRSGSRATSLPLSGRSGVRRSSARTSTAIAAFFGSTAGNASIRRRSSIAVGWSCHSRTAWPSYRASTSSAACTSHSAMTAPNRCSRGGRCTAMLTVSGLSASRAGLSPPSRSRNKYGSAHAWSAGTPAAATTASTNANASRRISASAFASRVSSGFPPPIWAASASAWARSTRPMARSSGSGGGLSPPGGRGAASCGGLSPAGGRGAASCGVPCPPRDSPRRNQACRAQPGRSSSRSLTARQEGLYGASSSRQCCTISKESYPAGTSSRVRASARPDRRSRLNSDRLTG